MENNTITPTPGPEPQPAVSPMPTFGGSNSAGSTATPAPAAPVAQAAPVASVSPAAPASPATPAASITSVPAAASSTATAPVSPVGSAPAATPAAAAAPAATPSATPAPAEQTAPITPVEPTTSTQPVTDPAAAPAKAPVNKGRLIALIAIIAGLLIAGIIAAVIIANVIGRQNDPATIAGTAMSKFTDPATAPKGISGDVELVKDDDTLASASFILKGDDLYLSYEGISDLTSEYLSLDEAKEQTEELTSLTALMDLIEFAEKDWWQLTLEDFDLAAAYRAHPFLVVREADEKGYRLGIDEDKLIELVSSFEIDLSDFTEEELSVDQIKDVIKNVPEFNAAIDQENRFSRFYLNATEELPLNININFSYGEVNSPEEYRPITELVSEFMKTIGY